MAAFLEMNYQNYSKMERGCYKPSLQKFVELCENFVLHRMIYWEVQMGSGQVATSQQRKGVVVLSKTKLCEDKESVRCDFVAGMIVGGLRRKNMSTDIASRKAGMSERTLRNKLQNPTSIKLGELYKLADMVGISINIKYKDIPE